MTHSKEQRFLNKEQQKPVRKTPSIPSIFPFQTFACLLLMETLTYSIPNSINTQLLLLRECYRKKIRCHAYVQHMFQNKQASTSLFLTCTFSLLMEWQLPSICSGLFSFVYLLWNMWCPQHMFHNRMSRPATPFLLKRLLRCGYPVQSDIGPRHGR